LRVYGDADASNCAWVDGSLVRTLPQFAKAVRTRIGDETALERTGRAVAIMEQIATARR
jgi:hypothetical protein